MNTKMNADALKRYDNKKCRVFLTSDICLIGVVQCDGQWIHITKNNKQSCTVNVDNIVCISEL